jgi:hypothetical protein
MSLELTCTLIQLLPEQKGQGKNGEWIKQDFIVETSGEYPKKIAMSAWGDMVGKINSFAPSSSLKIAFRLESREYNGRWYTDVRPWKIENAIGAQAPAGNTTTNAYATTQQPAMAPMAAMSNNDSSSEKDDLPF